MAHLKLLAGTAISFLITGVASAQMTTVIEAVPTADTEIVRAQFISEGDVSPEEYAALLAEADKIRAYQGNSGAYTGVSYEAVQAGETKVVTDSYGYEVEIFAAPTAATQYSAAAYTNTTQYPQVTYPMAKTYPVGTDFSSAEFTTTSYTTSVPTILAASTPVVTYDAPVTTYQSSASTSHYIVKGDTLYNIAKRNNTSVSALKAANNMAGNGISLGQTLIIPSTERIINVERHNYSAPVTSVSTVVSEPTPRSSRPTLVRNVEPLPKGNIYAVLPKDTLYSIARRACVSVSDMTALNTSINPQTLQPGQRLTLPGGHCLR